MTGNHWNTSLTRRRALVVAGGTVAAGGLAATGYQLVRKAITEGKSGVPLTLRLTVVDATDGCTPVPGAADGLLTLEPVHEKDPSKGYKGSLTLGIDPDAENTGAGSGGGG
ncbi:hypothetical protein [Streptomyces chartreusis]|uniref:Protocatechuate 3,4-dioxygenase beta subunit n=1 Tax=Streptomyces chartreusis NRRL 3882 TaxID=1079985 RepID=A0A2N9BBD3_STRCX|nr:Protocatechuate 3,4-dioxygenase beta subunit [Streptomyces chartreusis NRRL 3882]